MVNLADAQAPQPPQDRSPSLSAGRSLSSLPESTHSESIRRMFASSNRRRSLSESGTMRALEHSSQRRRFSSLSSYSSSEAEPRRLRVVSFRSPQASSVDHLPIHTVMSPLSDSEEEREEVHSEGAKKGETLEGANEEDDESRPRTHSDGSLMIDDDDTITDFVSKRRAPSTLDTAPHQRYIFGRPVPLWCTTRPKATAVAACLVKYAPCFWCSRESLSRTTTNQAILRRLISLSCFFALLQVASGSFLAIVLFSETLLDRNAQYVNRGRDGELVNTPNLWNVNGSILGAGLLGLCTFIGLACSRRSLSDIFLPGALRFTWFMLWIIPIQVYLFVSMFDYHHVTDVWIKHWWAAEATSWFRSNTCAGGTYNTLCVVPIDGLPLFPNETAWCEFYYNSTACEPIRNKAQGKIKQSLYFYYAINGGVGITVTLLLMLMVKVLEGVITKPIMLKSRERNIPMWLMLPIVGCAVTGALLLFSPSSILKVDTTATKAWPGLIYLVAAGLYILAALLGYCISKFAILNTRDKRTKSFMVILFILVMVLTVLTVAAIFVGSVILSTSFTDTTVSYELRGTLACSISAGSCSYCDNDRGLPECPEWTVDDVTRVIKTQLKASATIAALLMFYSLGALRFGITLRKHISMYQIDYV